MEVKHKHILINYSFALMTLDDTQKADLNFKTTITKLTSESFLKRNIQQKLVLK